MKKYKKYIFHIDIDAYFAQAEEKRNPQLKGKPVGVGFGNKRGILSTVNYIAREFGLHSGMPYFKAIKACPNMVLVTADHKYYYELSNEIFKFVENKFKIKVEVGSVDEVYIDVSSNVNRYDNDYLKLANEIKDSIFKKFDLTCSIGISDIKIFSKIATEFNKPNGIATLFSNEIKKKLYNKPIKVLLGVGSKTNAILKENDIITVYDFILLYEDDLERAQELFGNKKPLMLYEQATGKINDPIDVEFRDVKSLSRDKTYSINLDS
jgi:DNA polymerase-4